MQNITMTTKGTILTITVDLNKRGAKSKSGKTTIIASTGGNVPVPGTDTGAIIGLNIYTKGE